jgi:hypothetical protein
MTTKETYKLLVGNIYKYGKSFPKKHGNWIKLALFKDYYLSLDSWNGKVLFQRGEGYYNEWTGFGAEFGKEDKYICFLGGDFGEFIEPEREETLNWIVRDILKIS